MAHFAKLNLNNIVENVIVVSNEFIQDENGNEVEQIGIDFCKSLYGQNTNWVQTSYNDNFRKQYAGIGYAYNEPNDVFTIPQPYLSWVLNENFDWVAPVEFPIDGKTYAWNEETTSWDLFIPQKLYASWIWNETEWDWQPPTPYPTDGQNYQWNEKTQTWDLITE